MFGGMINPATLSKQQLLDLVQEQSKVLHAQEHEIAQNKDIICQLEAKNRQLEKDYLQLFRERFGKKSERYIADPDQLRIDFGDTEDAADAADGLAEAVEEANLIPAHKRRKPKKQSHALPAHLPRVEETVDAPEAEKVCPEHGQKQLLPESMWDVREKLVMIPAKLEVHVSKYKKDACPNQPQCGIASAERPTGIVEGDKYDTSVATQIISRKYGYFLTLYRLQNLFAGSGWAPSRSLLLNILTNSYKVLTRLPGFSRADASDVSADGSFVVGTLREGNVNIAEAFRWTDGGGMVGLGTLSGGPTSYSVASGVSADGLAVVGWSGSNPNVGESYLWTEGGGMQGLGVLPGDTDSGAHGISADGSTVVGVSGNCCEAQAYRWTAGTGMLGLGYLPGRDVSAATGVSGDGSVVVGYSEHFNGTSDGEAFIWDETHGMRRLQDVLTAAGLDLTGWRLQYTGDVSDDGNVIVGWGDNPAGRREGWIARLNVVPDFNSDGLIDCMDVDSLVGEIVAGTDNQLFDLTGDGIVDTADLDEWRVPAGAVNLPSGNPYLPGDANLDGYVDVSDFNVRNSHRLSQTPAWCSGDFNADGFVDASDFNVWNSHRLTSSGGAPAAVPEPEALWLSFVALGWLIAHRRLW